MSVHGWSDALQRATIARSVATLGLWLALLIGVLALGSGGLVTPAPSVAVSHASWAFEVGDDRLLTGYADNIFLGEVLSAEAGDARWASDGDAGYPTTVYTVRPVENIKGHLTETVELIQLGGYGEDGSMRLFDGDELLAPGSMYLLVVRGTVDGYRLGAPGYDHYLAEGSEQRAALVERFTAAVANQQDPFPATASPESATP